MSVTRSLPEARRHLRRAAVLCAASAAALLAPAAAPAAVVLHVKATRGHQIITARGVVLTKRGRAMAGAPPQLLVKFPTLRCAGAGTAFPDLQDAAGHFLISLLHPGPTGDCGARSAVATASFNGRRDTAATTYGRVTIGQRWSKLPRAIRRRAKPIFLHMGIQFYGIVARANPCHPTRNVPMSEHNGAAFFIARTGSRVTGFGVDAGPLNPHC